MKKGRYQPEEHNKKMSKRWVCIVPQEVSGACQPTLSSCLFGICRPILGLENKGCCFPLSSTWAKVLERVTYVVYDNTCRAA